MDELENTITEATEPFINQASDVFNIRLQRPDPKSQKTVAVHDEPFKPAFTYAIFGEEEIIFGYKDLELWLDFQAHDMQPSLEIEYQQKWAPIGGVKAMDIKELLKEFLPQSALDDSEKQKTSITANSDYSKWRPPGKLVSSYSRQGKKFEIWCASLSDPKAKELLQRTQILIPLFIEGGTCQNLDDQPWTMERWKVFFLYEVVSTKKSPQMSPYIFAGLATSYRLWAFPQYSKPATPDPEELPDRPSIENDLAHRESTAERIDFDDPNYSPLDHASRERISQFLILPPYQGQSHGTQLYNTLYDLFHKDAYVFEITVEDPNESFDDMRDWCDLARLRTNPSFASLQIASKVPKELLDADLEVPVSELVPEVMLEELRKESKIIPRQFARLVEMQLLSKIPRLNRSVARITRKANAADPNDRRYYFWRLFVKERLYRRNADQLAQIDADERVPKVEEALLGVEDEYERLLEVAAQRARHVQTVAGSEKNREKKSKAEKVDRKKRVVDETESDEFEEVAQPPGKKKKVA